MLGGKYRVWRQYLCLAALGLAHANRQQLGLQAPLGGAGT
jgi:hypothetical protein